MKNGSISDQLNIQEREMKEATQKQTTPQNTISGEKEKKQTVTPPKIKRNPKRGQRR